MVSRRSYIALEGVIPGWESNSVVVVAEPNLTGIYGSSIVHGDDHFSPHLISLFTVGRDNQQREPGYVAP